MVCVLAVRKLVNIDHIDTGSAASIDGKGEAGCWTLVVEDDIQERAMHVHAAAVVVNKSEFAELVHEETDA